MLAPGVTYLEVEAPKPGAGSLRSDVVGLGGLFRRGPIFRPTPVEDWGDHKALFGGFFRLNDRGRHAFGPLAVYGHFVNGGGTTVVVRMGGRSMRSALALLPDPATGLPIGLCASSPGTWANGVGLHLPLKVLRRTQVVAFPVPLNGVLRSGDLVRIRRGSELRVGRLVEEAGALVPWPIGPIPQSAQPLVVEVIDPNVEVAIDAEGHRERWPRLSLCLEHPRFVWKVLAGAALEATWRPPVPAEWEPVSPDDPLYLALAQQEPAGSQWVRATTHPLFPSTWPPPVGIWPQPWGAPVPALPSPWPLLPGNVDLGGPALAVELAGGDDALPTVNDAAARETIRILAVHPDPGVVLLPDLMLPWAPVDEPAPVGPLPDVPPEPQGPKPEPCRSAPLEPSPCSPPGVEVAPPAYPPGAPSTTPFDLGLPHFGHLLQLQAELLDAICADPTRAASLDTAGDRVALLDAPPGLVPRAAVAHAEALRSATSSGAFGGLLYPWLRILDPEVEARRTMLVPASGHLAGILARVSRRASPGSRFANLPLQGVIGSERSLAYPDRGLLNEAHLIALHNVPSRGTSAMGARGIGLGREPGEHPRPDRFLPAARVVAYLRRVLRALGNTLVFEPNEPNLWLRIRLVLEAVLNDLYRQNVLSGRNEEEAYRVVCGPENNPRAEIDAGRVLAEVSIAPAAPLEFITLRIAFARDEAVILEDFSTGGG